MCDVVVVEQDEHQKPDKNEVNVNAALDPDNPLLQQFQLALNKYLTSQIELAKSEIYELEIETQKKNADLEVRGIQTYQIQQQTYKQQEILASLIEKIEKVNSACEEEEEQLNKSKDELKEIEENIFQTERNNKTLLKEISAIGELNYCLSQSENILENSIQVNKTIASKRRVENEQMSKEKIKQDYFIQLLVTELWKLENSIETSQLELKVKQEYIDDMENQIAIANTNISAIQMEYKCLMHSWNSVVVAIGRRDAGLECLQEKLKCLKEKRASLITEIKSIKKQTKKELCENERLMYFYKNLQAEKEVNLKQHGTEMDKKNQLHNHMMEFQKIILQTEKDIELVMEENKLKMIGQESVQKQYDIMIENKNAMEREINRVVADQTSINKKSNKYKRLLETVAEKRISASVTFQNCLNRKGFVAAEIERHKLDNEELMTKKNDVYQQIQKMQKELVNLKNQIEAQECQYSKKKTVYQLVREKMSAAAAKQGDGEITSKEEVKLKELEKLIQDSQEIIKQLQHNWLSEQNSLLGLATDRQEQIRITNLLKKQALIRKQQNLRIFDELETVKKQDEKIKINIQMLSAKFDRISKKVFQKRDQKKNLNNNNVFLQGEYDNRLRDAELDLLRIESNLSEIEEDKLVLSKDLIEINKEILAWESKFILAKEALLNSRDDQMKGGEMNILRKQKCQREIMLSHLQYTQAKLVKDIELCVSKRETISFKSKVKQELQNKSGQKNLDQSKITCARRKADVKNRIKQNKNEIEVTKQTMNLKQTQMNNMIKSINEIAEKCSFLKDLQQNQKRVIEEAKTNRQCKFELLIYYQRKAELFRLLLKNRKPFRKYKTDDELISEFEIEKNVNLKLIALIDMLEKKFPDKIHELHRLFNSMSLLLVTL